eukprot:TRINITY_DN349_c0_g1_i1.p2 TRINITY_DN349_c0_g1~~TRINITY_DN349_c0_g1_i1.p2  ORF type:complete len:310 (+),score=189.01 TRINITY_DN349_c0_g1_i1:61-990(+)
MFRAVKHFSRFASTAVTKADPELQKAVTEVDAFIRKTTDAIAAAGVTPVKPNIDWSNVANVAPKDLFPEFKEYLEKLEKEVLALPAEKQKTYLSRPEEIQANLGDLMYSSANKITVYKMKEAEDLAKEAEKAQAEVSEPDWEAFREAASQKEVIDRIRKEYETSVAPDFETQAQLELFRTQFLPLVKEAIDESKKAEETLAVIKEEAERQELITARADNLTVDEFLALYPGMREEIENEIDNNNWDYEYEEAFKDDFVPRKRDAAKPSVPAVTLKAAHTHDEAILKNANGVLARKLREALAAKGVHIQA